VVDYLITKIKGFFKRVGVEERGKASLSKPVRLKVKDNLKAGPSGGETSHT
jgi:hypothetical protein